MLGVAKYVSNKSNALKRCISPLFTSSCRYLSQRQDGYFYEESAFDPLKSKFDERQHKIYGSMDAKRLTEEDQRRLMPEDNKAAVLNKALEVEIYPMERPSIIQPWEVLLQIDHVGICGSDLEYYKHGVIGPFLLDQPMIMGHETGATVLATGSAVENVKVGQRVALEPGLVCGECEHCESKQYNLCPEVAFFATPRVHGTMRRYMKHHHKYCFPIPDNINTEEAAWCEPLSVGIHAGGANIANIAATPNAVVGIFGAGPIGIINMLTSIYYGAAYIFITDINDNKLKMVEDYVTDNKISGCKIITINTAKTGPVTKEYLQENLLQSGDVDHTLECVGNQHVLTNAINVTRSGGMVTVIGMAADPNMKIDMSTFNIFERQLTINGVFRYRYTYEDAIKMVSGGKVGDVKQLITHRANPWDPKQLESALKMLDPQEQEQSGKTQMKIMYDMSMQAV